MIRTRMIGALLLAGITLLVSVASAVIDLTSSPQAGGGPISPLEVLPVAAFLWGTPLLGLLLAVRRPSNPVGWLMIVMVLGWGLGFASDDLAHRAPPSSLVPALAVAQQVAGLGFLGFILLLIFFPNGTLPSRRWRLLPALTIVGWTLSAVSGLFTAGSLVSDPPVPGLVNPFGQATWGPALTVFGTVGQLMLVAVVAGAVALLTTRLRRSAGVERQQVKWFVSAGSLTALLFLSALAIGSVDPEAPAGSVLWALGLSSLLLIPVAAAIAVLRYRLYDIDRIISRTVSYTVVSGLLASVFVGLVLGLQALLAPFAGGGGSVAVAASTLVVFAIFAPVRRRIRHVVDRRFDRARYDADRILGDFAARVRDDVELQALVDEMVRVTSLTVAPASTAVWLRGDERRG